LQTTFGLPVEIMNEKPFVIEIIVMGTTVGPVVIVPVTKQLGGRYIVPESPTRATPSVPPLRTTLPALGPMLSCPVASTEIDEAVDTSPTQTG
jgi:hypothetical protein